jgi:hypothetical protein
MNFDPRNRDPNEPKKQLDEKKVAEMRSKISQKMNKWADRIQVSMAITPKITRYEGDRWTDDNGKTWEIKGGIKQSVSHLIEARMPHWCPKCTKPMNHKFDRKFYYLRGWCYDCNVEHDGAMMANGTWPKFEKEMMRANEISWLKDNIQRELDVIHNFKEPQLMFEDGRIEILAGREEFSELFKKLEEDIQLMMDRLEVIKREQEAEEQQVFEETTQEEQSK